MFREKLPCLKLEFFALKWAVTEKFHEYLFGNKVHVFTDNNPLTYVLTTAKLDAAGLSSLAALTNYDLTLTYKSGKMNIDADALSRRSQSEQDNSSSVNESPHISAQAFQAIVDYVDNADIDCTPYVEVIGSSVHVGEDNDNDNTNSNNNDDDDDHDVMHAFPNLPPNWAEEQCKDLVISRVIKYLESRTCPPTRLRRAECPEVQLLLKD